MCHVCRSQVLSLCGNRIRDVGVSALTSALASGAMALTVLRLPGNEITDEGFATLMPLMKEDGTLSNLIQFSIGSRITDNGMKEFAGILAIGAMAHLQVS